MELELNPALDANALASAFATKGRIHIENLWTTPGAERIHACLEGETPWRLVYYDAGQPVQLTADQMQAMDRDAQNALINQIMTRARNEYQFLYYTYPMLTAYIEGWDPELFLHRVFEFINSPPMLEFVRQVTGFDDIIKADAQATMYRNNQFLCYHQDQFDDEGWRVAYVLNFTKGWRPDWGGFLQFYNDDLNIEDAYLPKFNALNMFAVPADHSVSYITPFAGAPRYSITGWFRNK